MFERFFVFTHKPGFWVEVFLMLLAKNHKSESKAPSDLNEW